MERERPDLALLDLMLPGLSGEAPGRGLPQAHRHPGQQLPQDEGLGDVVRRAPQEGTANRETGRMR